MAYVKIDNVGVRFPAIGVDNRSLKKHLARIAIGGQLFRSAQGATVVDALHNVSFSIEDGDRLGLVGPNGCGKTTLLRTLAGAYYPNRGKVETSGRIVSLLDLSMGMDISATGLDNIRLRGLVAGFSAKEIAAKTDEISEFSGLGSFLSLPVKTYSAGMMARLAFSVVTSVQADILLMDEWIAVGDEEFRNMAHKRLTSMVDNAGILVFASHDIAMIGKLCNKILRLDHGLAGSVEVIETVN